MFCFLETSANLIPGWTSLHSQRSHDHPTAIPSPGFENKCVYRSSTTRCIGENSDRQQLSPLANMPTQPPQTQKRTDAATTGKQSTNQSERSQKAISLLTRVCHKTKTMKPRLRNQTQLHWMTSVIFHLPFIFNVFLCDKHPVCVCVVRFNHFCSSFFMHPWKVLLSYWIHPSLHTFMMKTSKSDTSQSTESP